MTAHDVEAEQLRRVRPWIAALLTFLGWGVGLFYARRTRAAIWCAAASVAAGVLLGAGAFIYAALTKSFPSWLFRPGNWSALDSIQITISALLAAWVWFLAAKKQRVMKAGMVRLWGYAAIFFVPIVVSLVLGMTVRTLVTQPFRIPSGAMQPTLQVGDYIVVTKGSYGYSRYSAAPLEAAFPAGRVFSKSPERGDIVVFRPPHEPDRDFVKRLIGMPGDRIQMNDGMLYINEAPVGRERLGFTADCPDPGGAQIDAIAYRETLPNGVTYIICDKGVTELDNTRAYVVPEGHYFMMGDDRDNSDDSRHSVGYVPFDNLVGRVDFIVGGPSSDQPDLIRTAHP